MELNDLIGEHLLTGVDFDGNTINFVLDNETYSATEDPIDGYRSCLEEIKKSEAIVKNTFEPCKVKGDMRSSGCEIIDFADTVTQKIVLSIGTDTTDDCYPFYVVSFTPENMSSNVKYQPLL